MSQNSISEKFEQVLESFGPNTGYVWDVLQQYLDDPNSVNETCQQLFAEVVASGTIQIPKKIEQHTTNGNGASKEENFTKQTITKPAPKADKPAASPSLEAIHKQLSIINGVAAKIVDNM